MTPIGQETYNVQCDSKYKTSFCPKYTEFAHFTLLFDSLKGSNMNKGVHRSFKTITALIMIKLERYNQHEFEEIKTRTYFHHKNNFL